MAFPCNQCSSTFREKKNLQQHMRKQHGLQKHKCNYCDFRSNDQSNLKRHEKTNHYYELFQCKQCEYTTPRKDKLNQHIRSKHIDKNLKCKQCNFVTDRNEYLKKHVSAIHSLKKCKECDFETYLQKELKNHMNMQHEPDNFVEKSAFNRAIYHKTWKVRGMQEPLSTLNLYKAKIRYSINHYLETKGPTKWYLGMEIIMHKRDKEGNIVQEADPGFTSNTNTSLHMWNFDELYNECSEKIMNDFVQFNANGSGWILSRVRLISVHMHAIPGINVDDSELPEDSDDEL